MKKTILFLLVMLSLVFTASCGGRPAKIDDEGQKLIRNQAERMVTEDIINQYAGMGVEIVEYEINDILPAAQIPYSKGGTFDFYEITYRLQPKDQEQVKRCEKMYNVKIIVDEEGWISQKEASTSKDGRPAFISVYNDRGELYEFNRYYGTEFIGFIRDGKYLDEKYNKKAIQERVGYLYEDIKQAEVVEEYTLSIGESTFSIGQNFKGDIGLKNVQVEKSQSGDLMGVITRYKETWSTEDFSAETYCYFERRYEPLLRMITTNIEAETPRGIKVGSSQEELLRAYGEENLVFSSKGFGGESFNNYGAARVLEENEDLTCFGFTGEDETNNYIAFYMKDGKVSAIEMGTGFDYKPFKKAKGEYTLEVEDLINDHVDEVGLMKYDVRIPKLKDSVSSSESMNLIIEQDFQRIIEFSQTGKYEPITEGYAYPWVRIDYSVSNPGTVAVLNIFHTYTSALGSGVDRYVNSYYYDTTCGARMSEEAALYKLGYPKEILENYFKFKYPEVVKDFGNSAASFENITFYFNGTGEPQFIVNGYS